MNQVLCISTNDGGDIEWHATHPQIGDILQPLRVDTGFNGKKIYMFERWPFGFGVECFVELTPVSEIELKSEACVN